MSLRNVLSDQYSWIKSACRRKPPRRHGAYINAGATTPSTEFLPLLGRRTPQANQLASLAGAGYRLAAGARHPSWIRLGSGGVILNTIALRSLWHRPAGRLAPGHSISRSARRLAAYHLPPAPCAAGPASRGEKGTARNQLAQLDNWLSLAEPGGRRAYAPRRSRLAGQMVFCSASAGKC